MTAEDNAALKTKRKPSGGTPCRSGKMCGEAMGNRDAAFCLQTTFSGNSTRHHSFPSLRDTPSMKVCHPPLGMQSLFSCLDKKATTQR
ncbi:MAG: hypothetical protein R3C59_23455 [Planctomycetaceae bacterium]